MPNISNCHKNRNSSFISGSNLSLEEDTPEREFAREAARKQIEDDLASYAEKFNKHVNEVIESLDAKVDQIIASAINVQKPTVEQRMRRLDTMIDNELQFLRSTIISLARDYKPGGSEEERNLNKLTAFDKLFQATSTVGKLVKENVQEIRWDSQKFLGRVFDEVAAEADMRIEKVDSFIESGIQELGVKWAWEVDGVIYKDWARYQDLKKEFSGIKSKVIQAAEKNKKLTEIANWVESEAWEGGANVRAKEVANELGRLRRIAKKKIELSDYSEDFSDKYLTAESPLTDEVIHAKANQGTAVRDCSTGVVIAGGHIVVGEQHATIQAGNMLEDIVVTAAKGGYESASGVTASVLTPPPAVENILSSANHKLEGIVESAMRNIYGQEEGIVERTTNAVDEAYDAAVIYNREIGTLESALSMMSGVAQSASVEISIAIYGTPECPVEKATSVTARRATQILGEQYQEAKSAGKQEDEYYSRLFESAQTKLITTVEGARAKLEEILRRSKTENVGKMVEGAKVTVDGATEMVGGASKEKHQWQTKDEL